VTPVSRALLVALAAGSAAVTLAAPAAADEAEYLKIQDRLAFLSVDQLRTEGARVCQATRSGIPAADIVQMVVHDLRGTGATVAAANVIVANAVTKLGC
jgi:hypothetical protein